MPDRRASNPELENAIIADPDHAQAYLAYARWLEPLGDPRAKLITLQHAAASAPDDKKLAAAAAAHLKAHEKELLGWLAPWQQCQDGRDQPAFAWRNGFIYAARLSIDEHSDSEFEGQLEHMYGLLLDHPSGRFLVELRTGMNLTSYDNDQQSILEAIARRPPPALRLLHIGDFEYPDECEMSWYNIGDLGAVWAALPQLRTLIVQGGSWTMGTVVLPEVRHVELRTGGLAEESGLAIARAAMPKVDHLEIWYGDDSYGGECTVETVAPLLARTDLPALRRLGLRNAQFTDELCRVLAGSKLVPQLTHLDLSMGIMTDDGARALAADQRAFAHLRELDVSDTYVTEDGVAALKGCARTIVANDLRDDDSDDRYVSVGE